MSFSISIVLDKRRAKSNGTYPVKLRVFNRISKKDKRYLLNVDLTTDEFNTIWINSENKNLRGTNKKMRLKLQAFETRANKEAEKLTVFDFGKFEMKYFRRSTDKNNVYYHFNLVIEENVKNGKIGTAESYKYTLKSLANFSEIEKNCPIEKLTFDAVTVDWLKEYQAYMTTQEKSFTTIAIYTRTLRVIFNNAISENDISKDVYPFGAKKYKILKAKKVKKALNSLQLKTLFNAKPSSINEEEAKAFWFFSYACNGMNLKDIALLKYSDFGKDSFTYYRAKTFDKTAEKIAITIYLTEFTNGVIAKFGNSNKKGLVFKILKTTDDSISQYKKIKNFTRYINDHIKRLAKSNDLPEDISTYWARHSFATNSLRKGASMEFISEALNHSDLNITKNYFAGFEDKAKKDFAENLLDF